MRQVIDLFLGLFLLIFQCSYKAFLVVLSAEWLLRDVLLMDELLPRHIVVTAVSDVLAGVQEEVDRRKLRRRSGRPAIDIPKEQLAMLLEHHFSITDVAHMMNDPLEGKHYSLGWKGVLHILIYQMPS